MKSNPAKPTLTLQHLLKLYLDGLSLNGHEQRILGALQKCRTAALGGHEQACNNCGEAKLHYNSCGNRHCPQCQGAHRERWVMEREHDLFDVPHYHVTFTVPAQLRPLFKLNERLLYNMLFKSMWGTLASFSNDKRSRLGAELGAIGILHTWTQKLEYHPHLHCIVPAGGLTQDGKWKAKGGRFLFSVKAMGTVFKNKFCDGLRQLRGKLLLSYGITAENFPAFLAGLRNKEWVVHSKAGFRGKESVLEYLGRYTHKIAISNYRLLNLSGGMVAFSYRDRAAGDIKKVMSLPVKEFLLRFKQHILPRGFVKIRHYGLFGTRVKKEKLARVRKALGQKQEEKKKKRSLAEVILETTQENIHRCKSCLEGTILVIKVLPKVRGSPGNTPATRQQNQY